MTQPATLEEPRIALPSDQDGSGRSLGAREVAEVVRVIESGTLTCTKGTACTTLEQRFSELVGAKYVIACSSGSAAVHCAIAAVDPEPGDEIITTPITDMGALAPILYQAAIPEAQMQQRLVADLLNRAFGGAARKLVAALTASDISDEELADIRQLLNEQGENHGHAD